MSHLLNHSHVDEFFEDFERQPLLPARLSQLGPGVAWDDFDGDGWDDLILPSGRGGKLALFRNDQKGGFTNVNEPFLQRLVSRDQTTPLGIGPLLLIGSANYEDGQTNGGWIRVMDMQRKVAGETLLGPEASTGPLALADIDGDGFLDLFVGGRAISGKYPAPATSILYKNENNRFVAKQRFEKLGLVSGAVFSDLDGDGDPDLILAMQWGPVRIFHNDQGHFTEVTEKLGMSQWKGLWNGVATGDFDNDGRPDIIVSNWGLNSRWKATPEHPFKLYYGDLDRNGIIDMIEARYDSEMQKEVPLRILKTVGPDIPLCAGKNAHLRGLRKRECAGDLRRNSEENRSARSEHAPNDAFSESRGSFRSATASARSPIHARFRHFRRRSRWGRKRRRAPEPKFLRDQPRNAALRRGPRFDPRGDGKGNLVPVPGQVSGVKVYGEQRGCALGDYDHDGRLDLVITQNAAATKLYHNHSAKPGVRVEVSGGPHNPVGIGSSLRIPVAGGVILREIQAGSGYWSLNSAVQVVHPAGDIEVRLPNGKQTVVKFKEGMKNVRVSVDGVVSSD